MEINTTEEQQVEAIKKWWGENRWSVIGGIVIGISALVGGRAWIDNNNIYTEMASVEYQMMMDLVAQGQMQPATDHGAQLLGKYADTAYASLAALAMAKIKLDGGDMVAASSHLRWVLNNTKQGPVRHEATLRLAQIFLAESKNDEALNLLNGHDSGVYSTAYNQLIGDIYIADGKTELARTAYIRALAEMSVSIQGRQQLQMKLDDLGLIGGTS